MRTVLQIVIFGNLMKVTHCEKHLKTEPTQTSGYVNTLKYTFLCYAAIKKQWDNKENLSG